MAAPPESIEVLARALAPPNRLSHSESPTSPALIRDELRLHLCRLMGRDGYSALLRRALMLAAPVSPALRGAQINPDGVVQGRPETWGENDSLQRQAMISLNTQLLKLMVSLLGEPLTRRIVSEACPDVLSDDSVEERGSE